MGLSILNGRKFLSKNFTSAAVLYELIEPFLELTLNGTLLSVSPVWIQIELKINSSLHTLSAITLEATVILLVPKRDVTANCWIGQTGIWHEREDRTFRCDGQESVVIRFLFMDTNSCNRSNFSYKSFFLIFYY